MRPNLSLVTLGVTDLERARAFYARLGWQDKGPVGADVSFYSLNGVVLGLWPRDLLAADAGFPTSPKPAFPGITLAHNCRSKAEVDATLRKAAEAGARLTRKAHDTEWGGYSGYFSDPEGFLWEVAWNPFWTLDDDGRVLL